MFAEKFDRWGGLAAAVGGPLWLFPWTGWFIEVGDAAGFLMAPKSFSKHHFCRDFVSPAMSCLGFSWGTKASMPFSLSALPHLDMNSRSYGVNSGPAQ